MAIQLYNTYWMRFPHSRRDHDLAVGNCLTLFDAAARAGVRRIVHISVLHPSLGSPYSYFRGKAAVEQGLADLGIPFAIARPAVLFGGRGVLINSIAWLLRHLPVFAIGGRGDYRIRGISVDDLAGLCVDLGTRGESIVVDAVGPQTLTFKELVQAVKSAVGSSALIVPVPGALLRTPSYSKGIVLRDKLLTNDEYQAMADGLAYSGAPASGRTVMTDWIAQHGPELGRRYANGQDHRRRRPRSRTRPAPGALQHRQAPRGHRLRHPRRRTRRTRRGHPSRTTHRPTRIPRNTGCNPTTTTTRSSVSPRQWLGIYNPNWCILSDTPRSLAAVTWLVASALAGLGTSRSPSSATSA